jgi:hypothetical protein
LARLDESIAAFNQRFILNLWNQGKVIIEITENNDFNTVDTVDTNG